MIKETLNTAVKEECDVLVCGGGIAGVAAALSAARLNKKVILCEREYILGGLATAGLVAVYLPICDGTGRQVSFGLAEELLKLSVSRKVYQGEGYNDWIKNPDSVKNEKTARYEVVFNPNLFAIDMEQLLLKSGVKILYGTVAVNAYKKDGFVNYVVFENKSGRFAIAPKGVIDATGDCDIAKFLSLPCELNVDKNPLASWYYNFTNGKVNLNTLGVCDNSDEKQQNGAKVQSLSGKRFSGLDGEELSEMTQLSHKSLLNDYIKRCETDPDYDVTTIATIPQIRMTRRLLGQYVLRESDNHKEFSDSLGLISDWRKRGPVFEISLGSLYNEQIKNFAAAGRCMSAAGAMWDIARVIPCCAVTGQAAGTTLAVCPDLTKIDIAKLQQTLKQNGVVLHEKDL